MSTTLVATYRKFELPWTASPEERSRLQRTLQYSIGTVLLLCLLVPLLPLPEGRDAAPQTVPPRLARLVLERRAAPPIPPPVVRETLPEVVQPTLAPTPRAPVEREVASPDPVDQARRKAASAGLLPFDDQLAALRDNVAAEKAMQTRNLTGVAGESTKAERSLITSGVGKGSGGINTATLSRGFGSGAGSLTGHQTTQVSSSIGGGGAVDGAAEVRRTSGSTKASRSREEIELVFDRNKSAIYALYSRALRDNPALQGKLVLEITISPGGSVTACTIVSSDLNDPELERKLVARIKLFQFEEKDVEAVTTTKPIDFFPA